MGDNQGHEFRGNQYTTGGGGSRGGGSRGGGSRGGGKSSTAKELAQVSKQIQRNWKSADYDKFDDWELEAKAEALLDKLDPIKGKK